MENKANTFKEIKDTNGASKKHGFEVFAGIEIKWVRCLTHLINEV